MAKLKFSRPLRLLARLSSAIARSEEKRTIIGDVEESLNGQVKMALSEFQLINGDGETSRDFCHISNAVQANLLAASSDRIEGHEVFKAQKKSGKVFQVGSQGLASLGNEKAKELLASGVIGELNYAEGFWARNSPVGAWQYDVPEDASEETVDWDRYLSNTNKRDFDALRFFRWRNYRDYGTGMSGDLFVHLFSSLHFITGSMGPDKVYASGGLRYWKDGREVPDVLMGVFDYPQAPQHPGFNLSLRCNFVDGTSGSTYLKLVGSEGSMDVDWERVTVKRNSNPRNDDAFLQEKTKDGGPAYADRKRMLPPKEMVYQVEDGYKGAHYDHFAGFFNAIRNNRTVVEDAKFGYRAAAPALLCNDSYFNDTVLKWDPVEMKLVK